MNRQPATSNANTPPESGFRRSMDWLHTWVGLTLGWVLYFMFVTGTIGYFDTEVDRWMQPELPAVQTHLDASDTARTILIALEEKAPSATRWFISLPTGRNQPYPSIFWQGASLEEGASAASGSLMLDGRNGNPIEARETGGGQLLYQMHWRLHYMARTHADVLVGIATLFMLVALITGVIVHKRIFKDFFTFRPRKGQRSWLDAHVVLSVVTLPFCLMITYSGLVFMGLSYMPLIVAAHFPGDEGRGQFIDEVFATPGLIEPANEPATLVSLDTPIREAEARWGKGRVRSIDIRHPEDRHARVILNEDIDQALANTGRQLVFDGVNGKLLHSVAAATNAAKGTRAVFVGLHEGLFAPPALRWLFFLSGLLGAGMIATGLQLWAVKRRQQAERRNNKPHAGLRLVEVLNVGTIVGLPIGIAAYFWANRLLPLDFAGRGDWEAHLLFLVWLSMLVHATVRPRHRVWTEQFALASIAFGALPLLSALTTDRHLGYSLVGGDWVFAGFDLTVLVLGTVFGWAAWQVRRVQRHRHTARRAASHHESRPAESASPV